MEFSTGTDSSVDSKFVYSAYEYGMVCDTYDASSNFAYCLGHSSSTFDILQILKTDKSILQVIVGDSGNNQFF